MEKTGEITEKTPDVEREEKPDKELKKQAEFRDAARVLKSEHSKTKA